MGVNAVHCSSLADDADTEDKVGPRLVLLEDSQIFKAWSTSAPASLCISNFAARYATDKTTKKDCRGKLPILSREGKEESDRMFEQVAKKIGIEDTVVNSDVDMCCRTCWIWGYIQGGHFVSFTKFGLPVLKHT